MLPRHQHRPKVRLGSKSVNDYVEATFKAQPFFAVYAGRHEFDGQMPDLSRAGIDEEITRLRAAPRLQSMPQACRMSRSSNAIIS
jgi:hypothetical protein